MMGRALLLLLVLVATTAGAYGPREVAADASLCRPVLAYADPGVDGPCPRARHEGAFTSTGCVDAACSLTLRLAAQGSGLPAAEKTLRALLLVGPEDAETVVCGAQGADALSCAGQVTVEIPLASGECVDVRARTLLVELKDVPPSLPVQADSLVTLCRADAYLGIG